MKNYFDNWVALCGLMASACLAITSCNELPRTVSIARAEGDSIRLTILSENALRVQVGHYLSAELEELIYLDDPKQAVEYQLSDNGKEVRLTLPQMQVVYNRDADVLSYLNALGDTVLSEQPHGRALIPTQAQEVQAVIAAQKFRSPADEHLFGLGQFQDGYVDVRGLSRRLTQVNTQIALPMVLSNKGYGLLWNNYGLTEFNPATNYIELQRSDEPSQSVRVNVTSTTGAKQEVRDINAFVGEFMVDEDGDYGLMLDVGQTMARKHKITIDGETLVEVNNLWLPPTTSLIAHLSAGSHEVVVEGEKNDKPVFSWRRVDNVTEWQSAVADGIDYTVMVGKPDEVIATYRKTTGEVPMLPEWALGYIHCRERYDSQAELLENAREFRQREIPIDCIVQDWQWWGKYGWNAMRFDEEKYPDPATMVNELHGANIRLMISVWAKLDKACELGQIAKEKGYYIPETDWVDFFNPEAADFYWSNQRDRLAKPYGIDAWWQDATEPENDDLVGRRVMAGILPGELYRNVFPLMVNKCVHSGLMSEDPSHRTMILTRSGFPGIQRYGVATWSGDVGHDWETLRRQIAGGLGQMAAGLPWWTYDAGGFFRPGDQYTNEDYQEVMLRWLQTSVFLPLMRVHGFVSQTEPWRYGAETEARMRKAIELRYRLLPYSYSIAADVSRRGYTMMRPLVMDFPNDPTALAQKGEFMFGPAMLVAPILEPQVRVWDVYLPAGSDWVDYYTGEKFSGGRTIAVEVQADRIPVMVRAGSIIPHSSVAKQHVADKADSPIELRIYRGDNGSFVLYEDAGDGFGYNDGQFSEIPFSWDDASQTLTIGSRKGTFPEMQSSRQFILTDGEKTATISYSGAAMTYTF